MTLRSWIPIEKLHSDGLSRNPGAIPFLEQYPEYIDWDYLHP
jgi:hypothetical protein